jgi:leucyl-tRNA---protein transferase
LPNQPIRLFATPPHGCSYFADRQAVTWFVDPSSSPARIDIGLYQSLLERGFRRSGPHIYQPHCPDCQACLPLRVPVLDWQPRRPQWRAWNRLAGRLVSYPLPPGLDPNQFALYRKYLDARHPDGDMADSDPEDYLRFLRAHWCRTRFVELRLDQELLAVAVTDYLPRGLSAVYTFFDPDLGHLSPGVVAILWQLQECRRLHLPYLYLGYWIADCRKMAYKQQYRPFEIYINGGWERRGD